jgi:hypothetical protein
MTCFPDCAGIECFFCAKSVKVVSRGRRDIGDLHTPPLLPPPQWR